MHPRETVEELFARCESRLGRYLAQLVRDRDLAADLLQDTFHDALCSRERLMAARSPEAWLFGIARHRALRALRRRGRLARALQRLTVREQHEDEDVTAVRDLLERSLSPEDRALVLLRYLHGFASLELAELTGMSPEAVRQRLSRARRRLRDAIEQESP